MIRDDLLQIPAHRVADLFPHMTAEEFQGLKNSILANGVQEPIKIWENDGRVWLIDGRHRRDAVKSIEAETGKKVDLPFSFVHGNEKELVSMVMAYGRDRRHLSASQRSAVTVKANVLFTRLSKRKIDRDTMEVGADELASTSGTNQTYIRQCLRLYFESPELFEAVVAGELSIPKALKKLEKMISKELESINKEVDNSVEPVAEESPPSTIELFDVFNQKIPSHLIPVFGNIKIYAEVIRKAKALKADFQSLAQSTEVGKHLQTKKIVSYVTGVITDLQSQRPHCVCTECFGEGCEACLDRGFLTVIQHKILSKQKEQAELQTQQQGEIQEELSNTDSDVLQESAAE